MTKIKEALRDFNPWWKGTFSIEFKQREVYSQLQKYLVMPQIIALSGLRRIGKTTLMLKIVEDSMRNGADSNTIVYFSFDEFKDTSLRTIMNEYGELMEMDLAVGNYLFLFDEIQKLEDWENQIKRIYDSFGKRIKILISGSESLFIRRKSKETLAGRMFEFRVEPLTFLEFLSFKGATFKPIGLYEKELHTLFDEYILTQGFPELVNVHDKDILKKYIKESIVEKVIYRDIQKLFRIKDVSVMESLLTLFLEEPGQLVEISSLSRELGIARQTLSNYLRYLEDSFLLKKLYNYSKSARKVERKLRKYYPTIISPNLLFKDDELSKSKVFEWLLVTQLKAQFFWRDPYKNEVDAVLTEMEIVPIEIKYGKIDTHGIVVFMKKFKIREGVVVTRNKEETHAFHAIKIRYVPAFKYLLESRIPNLK